MNKGFWKNVDKPIIALAPLANVTDAAFRSVIAKYSKPDGPSVMYTEFVSADGLFRADERGRRTLMRDLIFSEQERPIVAQFFTARPESMEHAACLAADLRFDGVDINMGCPDRNIEKQHAGAALIKNPERAREIIRSAKKGARGLPVSVKTRIGYHKISLREWLPSILKEGPAAVVLHLRTRKEMSKVPAHWDRMLEAVSIRNEMKSETLLLGNGDVESVCDAKKKAEETGADGVMIGRGVFGTPWLFRACTGAECGCPRTKNVSPEERLSIMVEHTKLFDELLGDVKSFSIMKKHFKAYVCGWDGAKELRAKLMDAENPEEVEKYTAEYIAHGGR